MVMSAVTAAAGFRPFERKAIESSIVRRFEDQVAREPERLAVKFGPTSLSYARLNDKANRIAHAVLAARGDLSEPVAVAVEEGCSLIAAILGVLKSGKFYVPLETAHPRERVTHLLRDSCAPLVIASASAAPVMRDLATSSLKILNIDDLDSTCSVANPGVDVAPGAYAYIYYTTGSTGQPKGVVDSHRNVLHNIMRYTNGLRITQEDRLTLLQSASFSGAVSSMFAALLNGAASFPFDVRHSSANELADYVDRERITIYHSVPTIFRSFLRGDRIFPSVRLVRLEGDQAGAIDLELFRRHFGRECILANGLGTTETGIVCRFLMSKDTTLSGAIVPIGYMVDDMEVSVVDEEGAPVAPGVTGEIAVRSEFLACGYWNRPDATSRAFLADPREASKRTYRTGDLGRMAPDGCVEHLGRKDSRVKIRGVTVALAEVEAALQQLPSIRETAAVARTDGSGERRLTAYYVAVAGQEPTASALRRQLANSLPSAMIPSAFVQLERLPINENLKVDRTQLPAPSGERPLVDQPFVRPRDPTEALLVGIWEQLLEVAPVGIRDDFFDLGGDSLLATQMIVAVEEAFDVDFPLSILLTGSTIEHVAQGLVPTMLHPAIVPIQTAGAKPPFYFVHGDYVGGGLYCREIARELGPDQPFFAVTPCGLDGERAPDSIEEMAERHLRALHAHQPQGPYFLGGNCNGGLIALEMAQRLVESGESVERLIIFRASARNARYRVLRNLVERSGWWLQISKAAQRTMIRHLRWFAESWVSESASARVGLVLHKVGKALRWSLGRQPSFDSTEKRLDCRQPTNRETLIPTFMDAAVDYVPLRYPGSIVVFWPEQDQESGNEALAWWRRVSPNAELETVPGDHLTAITVHAKEFARHLAERLAEPQLRAPDHSRSCT